MRNLRKRFNRIKRRIELGVEKPNDREQFVELGNRLGYNNYLSKIADEKQTD